MPGRSPDPSDRVTLGANAQLRGRANATIPVGPAAAGPPAPPAPEAGTRRYCRPPSSYIDGDPVVAPPNCSSEICVPVSLSYTWTLRSAAVANTSPAAVGMIPPLTDAAVPVPLMP